MQPVEVVIAAVDSSCMCLASVLTVATTCPQLQLTNVLFVNATVCARVLVCMVTRTLLPVAILLLLLQRLIYQMLT
jgi:hypothetical protein